ncbi:Acyl-CoA carboxylase subunit beta OS=Streptomyces alboniger OX=132473 GN=CP975_15385 PE=4 SV=1 [Streptomyces alboniger]
MTLRIGNASGFYGDRFDAMREMLTGGELDVLTGDYLAELTMLILGRDRLKDPGAGYARTFLRQLEECLGLAHERGVRIVTNAGGLNPAGLAQKVRELADRLGLPVRVAHVEGDDMATGEESDDESLGGAEMHARVQGLADHLAVDEQDALRQARRVVARLNHRKASGDPGPAAPPKYDEDELLGIVPGDLRTPFDPRRGRRPDRRRLRLRRVQAAVRDEPHHRLGHPARLSRRNPGERPGRPVQRGVQKAAQFIQLANQRDIPLLFLHNTTGYMVGKEYEQGGIIKHGAMMINAVSNSRVPHLSVLMGASYGAGRYGMCGRAFDPRFLFAWPSAKSAVMGPQQLAGVLSIVARQSAAAKGNPYDEDADAALRAMVEQQIESESLPMFLSGRLYDDGVMTRDTRTVLGLCLSAIHTAPYEGARSGFGVFRM